MKRELTHSQRRQPILFRWLILGLIILTFTLNACQNQQITPNDTLTNKLATTQDAQFYLVDRVVDGDTIVLNIDNKKVKVRLIGVDTPETVHPFKQVEAYGKEASTFLTNLLKGEKVYLEYEKGIPETDKYGRLLAYLYRVPDKLFINLEIIRQGYGHAYTKYPFKYMDLFRDTERQACEYGKGLWSPDIETEKPINAEPKPSLVNNDSKETKENTVETTVYVTKSGTKYHRADCKYLAKSKIPMSLKDAKTKYQPCSVCNPPK